jgi:hypothetical protein
VSASAGPSTGGFIQADPSTNSLIITAAEPMYRQLRAMIEQLDSRRAQVYIESMIVEVSGDNAADFGFQWQGLLGSSGDKYGVAAGTNFNAGNSSSNNIVSLSGALAGGTLTAPGQGLNIALLKNYGGTYALAAVARLLQSQTNTNICLDAEPDHAGQRGSQDRRRAATCPSSPASSPTPARRRPARSRLSSARTSASRCASSRRSARAARSA